MALTARKKFSVELNAVLKFDVLSVASFKILIKCLKL